MVTYVCISCLHQFTEPILHFGELNKDGTRSQEFSGSFLFLADLQQKMQYWTRQVEAVNLEKSYQPTRDKNFFSLPFKLKA